MIKTNSWVMKSIIFNDLRNFNTGSFLYLRKFLCIALGLLLSSCSALHNNIYLNKDSMEGISKVAILASVKAPNVSYSQESEFSRIIPLAFLIGALKDLSSAAEINEHVNLSHIEDKIALSFLQPLKDAGCFKSITYLKSMDAIGGNPSPSDHDAVIRLSADEIFISRAAGEYVNLNVRVVGQMKLMKSGKVIWDREERIPSPESRALEYYKDNALREIDTIMEKAGRKLADDFIYLQYLK